MRATEILMEEHRVIERVIAALDRASARLEKGEAVRPGFFEETSDFISGYADGCHHAKEEGVLFTALEAHGMPRDEGPIVVMLMEHEDGRSYNRRMLEAARRLAGGDAGAAVAVLSNARGYGALLRQHIRKEDQVLFPMADRVIPPGEQDGVWQEFHRVEEEMSRRGVQERYMAMASRLEAESAGR